MRLARVVTPIAAAAAMSGALALPAAASESTAAAACVVIWWAEPKVGDVTVDNNCANTIRLKAKYAGLIWGKCEPVWGYTTRVWHGTWAPVTGLANC